MRFSTQIIESTCQVCRRSFDETEQEHDESLCQECRDHLLDAWLKVQEDEEAGCLWA